MPSSHLLRCCRVLMPVVLTAGCSSVPYSARTLDPDMAVSEYTQRSGNADGLKRFAVANGYAQDAWPPAEWGLRELTLTALYFHPQIRTARASAEVAHAQLASAASPPPLGAKLKPQHHSLVPSGSEGPWSLGLELEIPLVAQGKREARTQRSAFLADAADIDVAAAAWQVRSRVRDRLVDLEAGREELVSTQAWLAARREMLALVGRRVEAGLLSARDLGVERVALAQLELARDRSAARADRVLGELAAALGLPLEVVGTMKFSFAAVEAPTFDAGAVVLRSLALRNRLDVHRKLLEFGAADAEVKLAVAAQNPDIVLGPGYTWDQGDNVWSLALRVSVPPAARAKAAIREAGAQRELAAQAFYAVQSEAIAGAERTAVQYRAARQRLAGAERQAKTQQEQEARILRQFDAGAADRLQRTQARIETLAVQAVLRAAQTEVRQTLAQLEDAVQRPLFGDFEVLPDARASWIPGVWAR